MPTLNSTPSTSLNNIAGLQPIQRIGSSPSQQALQNKACWMGAQSKNEPEFSGLKDLTPALVGLFEEQGVPARAARDLNLVCLVPRDEAATLTTLIDSLANLMHSHAGYGAAKLADSLCRRGVLSRGDYEIVRARDPRAGNSTSTSSSTSQGRSAGRTPTPNSDPASDRPLIGRGGNVRRNLSAIDLEAGQRANPSGSEGATQAGEGAQHPAAGLARLDGSLTWFQKFKNWSVWPRSVASGFYFGATGVECAFAAASMLRAAKALGDPTADRFYIATSAAHAVIAPMVTGYVYRICNQRARERNAQANAAPAEGPAANAQV